MTSNQQVANSDCIKTLEDTIKKFRDAKPSDKSELDRNFAVTITELEKAFAYFYTYVIDV